MARFTRELRQKIIRDFCARNNTAQFDPALFAKEVQEIGPEHPAYEWFEWDDTKAAYEHRLWQAREFAQGLKIRFEVKEVGRSGKIVIRQREAPMLISPVSDRQDGGGYVLTDPQNPDHMSELIRQAATDLNRWLRRYSSALEHAGGDVESVEAQAVILDGYTPQPEAKTATSTRAKIRALQVAA